MTRWAAPHHPDFDSLVEGWVLTLESDGYSPKTVASYTRALGNLATWLHEQHPDVGPLEMDRNHIRGWIVYQRNRTSSSTARSWFAGARHFTRWLVSEGETTKDATEGIRTPPPNPVRTETLKPADVNALLATCTGNTFVARRDRAIIMLFIDGGVRLAEVANLKVGSVDIRQRIVFVEGKGSMRSGPRRRAVPLGVKAAKALDQYLRSRAKHPYAHKDELWLGDRGRPTLSWAGVDAMLSRRGARAGVQFHAHMMRHSWASAFRKAGGSEGDLLTLGGWRSRQMLDRYGAVEAEERAAEVARRLSYGDRL